MNERQLTLLVERVGEALEPDVQTLVVGGRDRGRVRRRRRAGGTALAGVVAVGAVALTGVLLPRGTDAAPVVTDPPPPTRQVAVSPSDMGTVLASLLDGARVVQDDGEPYEYQRQRGEVRWRGTTVTVTIDSRSVGIDRGPRERCETSYGPYCTQAPGGIWVFAGGRSDGTSEGAEDVEVAYVPGGYVVEVAADEGAADRALLRRLVLDDVWFG
jgi:hypothetical protein